MSHSDPLEPTQRFTSRVDDYVRYRPSYPPQAITYLQEEWGLSAGSTVADVGSGTGILTERLLDAGCTVMAVEPNEAMRQTAETRLSGRDGFFSINGRAEATTLDGNSVDFVTAGQAFHWFEPTLTQQEFKRILRPDGVVALMWNTRDFEGSEFMAGYEAVMEGLGLSYSSVKQGSSREHLAQFFPSGHLRWDTGNEQVVDLTNLRGRFASSSYAPQPGTEAYEPAMAQLDSLFGRFEQGGYVTLLYRTEVFAGRLD